MWKSSQSSTGSTGTEKQPCTSAMSKPGTEAESGIVLLKGNGWVGTGEVTVR